MVWKGGDEHTLDLRMEKRWSIPDFSGHRFIRYLPEKGKAFGRLKETKVEFEDTFH